MKSFNIKDALLGIIAILLYFVLSSMQTLPFEMAGIDINYIPTWLKITYLIIFEIMMAGIMLIIFNKKIEKDFKDILLNHKEYYSKGIKYWFFGFLVMIVSNAFIIFILNNGIATNEENVRKLIELSPLYIYLSAVIFAPIVEELVFRQGIRNIFGRNILFVLISGVLFGALHMVNGIENALDLLYLIPYSSLGIAFAYDLYKTDNIFTSIGLHFMHNGILLGLQFVVLLFS